VLSSWGVDERLLVDGLLRWIDAGQGRPFYAMAWASQAITPTSPARASLRRLLRGPALPPDDYDLGRHTEHAAASGLAAGRLFDGLRERGLADDTLVLLTGDRRAFGDPHPSWGHRARIWEENVRVPLMIWSPRLFPRGGRAPPSAATWTSTRRLRG
jgi:phosphoglycerol transferase MdoB-like AlkP superfamily enzyme